MRIALLTESRYTQPRPGDWYIENIFQEDGLLGAALARRGAATERVDWADPTVDWGSFDAAMFRTPWDWFDRFAAFSAWVRDVPVRLLNDRALVTWNLDKHYLLDLERRGVPVVPTRVVERGGSLGEAWAATGWTRGVAKPAVSGCARETWRIGPITPADEARFARLVANEAMLLQPFVEDVVVNGELSAVVIDGELTHAVRKRAAAGDFRVQDDFGGTVERVEPTAAERAAAERAVAACEPAPIYARVDLVGAPDGTRWVSELEVIEPELFLRFAPAAAERLAAALVRAVGG